MSPPVPKIALVVFDWAGTTIDHGSQAPLQPFLRVFANHGIDLTREQVRGPMGLHKKDHIRALSQLPAVSLQWQEKMDRDFTEDDIEELFQQFIPYQLEVLNHHSQLIPGVIECVKNLRQRDIRIGATTGYFHSAAQRVYQAAAEQGYSPDCCVCAEEVAGGRPAPWMIQRIMQSVGIESPAQVVKVGDTGPDIGEGLAAGVWSVGVLRSSSEIGLSFAEWQALAAEDQQHRLLQCRNHLLQAGAHAVIESLAELPLLLDELESRLQRGEQPGFHKIGGLY